MFRIQKHYFDGIDDEGNAIIFYDAALWFFGIKIPYSSYILSKNSTTTEISRLGKSEIQNEIEIQNEKLKISGIWKREEKPIHLNLIDKNTKKLSWNCHTPKAKFNLKIDEKEFSGFGYAETLEMNFVPWKLPISELKWGRFLSESNSIIWIEWIGEQPLKKVFWNGNLIENAEISSTAIVFKNENSELLFQNPIAIKDEKLLSITEKYPFVKPFFKRKFLDSRELKFKSLSILKAPKSEEKGFSLYETVLWEK